MDIIIPTKNAELDLEDCLKALSYQSMPVNVFIIDARSTDKTIEIARKYGVKILHEPPSTVKGSKRALACNMGILNSYSPVVATIDSDTIVSHHWARDLSKYVKDDVGAVTSGCLPGKGGPLQRCISRILKVGSDSHGRQFTEKTPIDSAGGYNAVYQRKALVDVGLFSEDIGGLEDWELSYRIRNAGWKIYGVPESPVEHRERRSFKSFAKQMYGYAWSRSRTAKVKKIFTPVHALPTILMVALIALFVKIPVIMLSLTGWGIVLWGAILAIEVIMWGELTADILYMPPVLATFMGSWALGYIKGFID